jgi:single-strand DNA-binding protein
MKNQVALIGRLGKDPKIVQTSGGNKFAMFQIACDTSYYDKASAQWKKMTDWVPCKAWGGRATVAEKHLFKGSLVAVDGRFTTNSWTDRTTQQKRYSSEVTVDQLYLLDKGNGGRPSGNGGGGSKTEDFGEGKGDFGGASDDFGSDGFGDDEAPF